MAYGILIVEDESTLAKNMKRYLERHDYEVRVAGSGEDGLKQFEEFRPDVVLLDYNLPGLDGLAVLEKIHAIEQGIKVILVTAHGNVQVAVDAMKAGAYDYLSKPVILSELRLLIDKAVGQERLEETLSYYRQRDAAAHDVDSMLGTSPAIEALKQQVRRILAAEETLAGDTPAGILVTGETGTGKELVARAIHFGGSRRDAPFIEINCTALPGHLVEAELFGYERGAFTDARERKLGLVEAANGGTLFLDEIGDVEQGVQAKLLKLLEDKVVRRVGSVRDRKVDVRIIAATNRALEDMVQRGEFRSDLYYRLRVISLRVPPLHQRGDDILLLARHFLAIQGQRYARKNLALSADAERALLAHTWPGNVRELRNVVEQAVLFADGATIGASQLSLSIGGGPAPPADGGGASGDGETGGVTLPANGMNLEDVERDLVLQALERSSWNVTQAARLLGLSRDTMRYRMEKHDLKRHS